VGCEALPGLIGLCLCRMACGPQLTSSNLLVVLAACCVSSSCCCWQLGYDSGACAQAPPINRLCDPRGVTNLRLSVGCGNCCAVCTICLLTVMDVTVKCCQWHSCVLLLSHWQQICDAHMYVTTALVTTMPFQVCLVVFVLTPGSWGGWVDLLLGAQGFMMRINSCTCQQGRGFPLG
jgi:hypothetical protein